MYFPPKPLNLAVGLLLNLRKSIRFNLQAGDSSNSVLPS